MPKLGSAGGLVCVAVAFFSLLQGGPVQADEPPDLSSSWKQPRAVPAVLTSRGGADVSLERPTRASERREDARAADTPWIIRGTMGLFDSQH